jgi:hypothetical protein
MMKRSFLAAAAALAVSSGAALAAGGPQYQQPASNGYSGGYVFPEYGTPPGDPPAENNDSGDNGS